MGKEQTPPRWATKLLSRICSPNLLEEIEGDLLEEYQYQVDKHGPARANWDYISTVFGFIRLSIFRKKKVHNPSSITNSIMLRNYLITAFRNIIRHPSYAAINLTGLTLGLACSMLIFQFVTVERGADGFHEHVDHTYRVALERQINGEIDETYSQVFFGAGEAFTEEIPEVESYTRVLADFFQEGPTLSPNDEDEDDGFKDVRSIVVDSTFLSIFSFPLMKGDPGTALQLPDAILLTESMAQKMYGSSDPLGKIIHYGSGALSSQDFVVTGILEDVPENSHIQFDVVIPIRNFYGNVSEEDLARVAWNRSQFTTYVTTRPGANHEQIEHLMNDILARNVEQDNFKLTTTLQPMKSVYFDRETDLGLTGFGSAQTTTRTGNYWIVYFLMIIGIMTLTIAFISYVNLSTIRSLDRAKEVGVRKVIGAGKADLKWQFFLEATLMNFTALALAIGLLLLLKPLIYSYAHLNLSLGSMISKPFLLLFGGVFLVGVLLSGSYPAFVLSSFQPIMAIKEKITTSSGRSNFRRALIVFQYTAVVALLVCTAIVYQQLHYMQNKDIGLEMDQLITIRSPRFIPENTRSTDMETALKNQVLAVPSVRSVTFTGNQAGRGLNFSLPFQLDRVGSSEIRVAIGTGCRP